MKPKRTHEEAARLLAILDAAPDKYADYLTNLIGGEREAYIRNLPLVGPMAKPMGAKNVQELYEFCGFLTTAMDMGVCLGRLMYEETLPEGLEEKGMSTLIKPIWLKFGC